MAIKGLVTDIKSYCAALIPTALELLNYLPGEQEEALVQCWLAGIGSLPALLMECGVSRTCPAQQQSILVRVSSTLPPSHVSRRDGALQDGNREDSSAGSSPPG